jgi:hypothetical protein
MCRFCGLLLLLTEILTVLSHRCLRREDQRLAFRRWRSRPSLRVWCFRVREGGRLRRRVILREEGGRCEVGRNKG